MKRLLNLFPILFVVLFGLLFYRPFATKRSPNVLLITIDTIRQDHCSAYGYQRQTTPFMEQVAREGTLFADAYSAIPTTLPSHTTMFTSLYPISHGVLKNGFVAAPQQSTMAEIFLNKGYATAAFVSAFSLNGKFGLKQGFEVYSDDFAGDLHKSIRTMEGISTTYPIPVDRRGVSTAEKAIRWLTTQRKKDRPFFLWAHFFDAHDPYMPIAPQKGKFPPPPGADQLAKDISAYDEEIIAADRAMYQMIEALEKEGLTQNTLTIVAGDHGEGLMQHGHAHHGLLLYEEAVRVPWIFRWPGKIPAGKVVHGPVQLVDMLPTVLDYTGITYPDEKSFQGMSLLSFINGSATPDPNRLLFYQRRFYDPGMHEGIEIKGEKFAVHQGNWKYIEAIDEGTRELYDLEKDPAELHNQLDSFPQKTQELAGILDRWKKTNRRNVPLNQVISEQDLENLRALGYVQ